MVILSNLYKLKINSILNFLVYNRKFKVKASTIIETLIASIIIIVIFSIASMTLNNLFKANINQDTTVIETHLIKLQYLQENNKLTTPYYEDFKGWSIHITEDKNNYKNISFEASKDKKLLKKTILNVGY